MAEALKNLPQSDHPDLLVGYNSADDAGVFRISEDQALVQTLDFFPPIVDDPYQFGQIAAANALSDVFAMGGVPLTAMNIVGFPMHKFPPEILTELLRGGKDKIEEAGAVVVGGHSINDNELKYGVSITGLVHPGRVITNAGAKVGDVLFLTKRLGTGIVTTAIKKKTASPEQTKAVITEMSSLNQIASALMVKFSAHAATDITGYGLLGHAFEMASGSRVTIRLDSSKLPLLPGAVDLAEKGMITGGSATNRDYLKDRISIAKSVKPALTEIAFDPQTSGGLLVALAESSAKQFSAELKASGLCSEVIGRVEPASDYSVLLD